MNLTTMQIDNETLNYQYIIDLINETDCMYYYCLEDNCGYLYFYDNIQLSEFNSIAINYENDLYILYNNPFIITFPE